jgi:hypothetical protein
MYAISFFSICYFLCDSLLSLTYTQHGIGRDFYAMQGLSSKGGLELTECIFIITAANRRMY